MSDCFICITCGVQFPATAVPPNECPICVDERQYVRHAGQAWTTIEEMGSTHQNIVDELESRLYGIRTEPSFAIGQQACLIQSEHGNVLWDCISFIDDETVARVGQLGGIDKIGISHPHFYASAVEWAARFDAAVYLHEADREWVMRPSSRIRFWDGAQLEIQPGITLVHAGGHFAGSSVCHWADGAEQKGALLTGDTIHVVRDRRWVTFMRSYPNVIPLSATAVEKIVQAVGPYEFDRLYGAWHGLVVDGDAKEAVRRSAKRYIEAVS